MSKSVRNSPISTSVTVYFVVACLSLFPFAKIGISRSAQGDTPQENEVTLPEGTEFEVVTVDEISSKTASEGDALTFKVSEDVKVGGQIVIAKDSLVKGTVSNAHKSGRMGKSGSLGIRVESTTAVDGQKVRLRASKGKEGDDKTGSVIALTILVSPLFLLKHGKDAKIKPGTKLKVYTDDPTKVKLKV